MIAPVPVARVPHEWEAIKTTLAPAVERSSKSFGDLLSGLMTQEMTAFRLSGPASGFLVLSAGNVLGTTRKALWVLFAGGQVQGGPKQRVQTMRRVIAIVEQIAADAKCREVRVEGREPWRYVLNDYGVIGRDGNNTIFVKVI